MSYIESILGSGEEILFKARLSLFNFFGNLFFAALLVALGVALAIFTEPLFATLPLSLCALVLIALFIHIKTTELVLTNRRVIAKRGFICRSSVEVRIEKIESVDAQQGILGRIFGFGTIVVCGAGNSTPIAGINEPITFKRAVDELIEQRFRQLHAREVQDA